mmetsp:Transcript_19710/g.54269  ORF Transcript_19710/g.54269 Transcript_19710/m.54269 type:complete len:92 (+) Transcript_19710:340-615(+)
MTDPSSFQDHCKDIKSSIQADDQGDPDSHFKLGHWYELGRGVDQDYGKAVKYYNKAAHQGHTLDHQLVDNIPQPWHHSFPRHVHAYRANPN